MSELVVFPDVASWLIKHIDAALTARDEPYASDVLVSDDTRKGVVRCVVVNRVGGRRLDRFRELASVNVRVFAATDADATDLANLVRAIVAACADGKPVLRAEEQSGPTDVPDESGPLRLIVCDLTVRGAAA